MDIDYIQQNLEKTFKVNKTKNPELFAKVELIAAKYIFLRIIQDIDPKAADELSKKEITDITEYVSYFKKEIVNFENKFHNYFKEFLNFYGN